MLKTHSPLLTLVILALATTLATPAWGQPSYNVAAGNGHWLISGVPVSTTLPTDTIPFNTPLSGTRRWHLNLINSYPNAFTNPTISISTTLPPAAFVNGSAPGTITWSNLPANGGMVQTDFDLSQNVDPSLLAFTPGFDSSRTVSPLIIPPGVSQQTVTITVTTRDSRYTSNSLITPGAGIQISMPGANILSTTGPSNLSQGVEGYYGGLSLTNPQLNKPYTFSALVQVTNSGTSPIIYKPSVAIIGIVFEPGTQSAGGSVTIPDSLLGSGGGIAYSVGTSVNWNAGIQDNYNLIYGEVTAQPQDTLPPVISGMPPAGCTLWPPNHSMVQVATISAVDVASPGVPPSGMASLNVVATSNEPPDIQGAGNTPNDIVITSLGGSLGPYIVELRAERSGTGDGRVYTITATAADQAGNSTSSTATCVVPHN